MVKVLNNNKPMYGIKVCNKVQEKSYK